MKEDTEGFLRYCQCYTTDGNPKTGTEQEFKLRCGGELILVG